MYVHNYMCYARELKKAQQVLLYDVSQTSLTFAKTDSKNDGGLSDVSFSIEQANSPLDLFRCTMLNLETIVESEQVADKFKRFVNFKHVFLLGVTQEILDSHTMNQFLQTMVEKKMNPINLFIVKNSEKKSDIERQGYNHLCIKQKLPQYPNIILKDSDFRLKAKSKVLMC